MPEQKKTKYLFVHSNHYGISVDGYGISVDGNVSLPGTDWRVIIDDEVPEHVAIILDKLPPVRVMHWPELDLKHRFHYQLPAPVRVHDFPKRYEKDGIRYGLKRIDVDLDNNTETAVYLKD